MKKTINQYRSNNKFFKKIKWEIKAQTDKALKSLHKLSPEETMIKLINNGGIKIKKLQSTIIKPNSYLFRFNYMKAKHYGIYEDGNYVFGDYEHLLLKDNSKQQPEQKL